MSAKRGRNRGKQGFVLIELLVALSVVAVMAALMAGFLGQLRAVAQVREEMFARTELAAAAAHLQRTLAGARKAPLPDNEPETNYVFDGAAAAMRFATVTRQGFYSLALRDVRIFREPEGGRLVETLQPRRPEGAAAAPTRIVILDRVDTIRFEYSEDGASYTSAWKRDGLLPLTVRVTIGRKVGAKTVTASAIAHLL